MNEAKLPPYVKASDNIILFDGVCKLCNAWSNFIIKHDRKRKFILCSVQSEQGQEILRYFGFPTEYYDTMLYVEGNQCFKQSGAFLRIVAKLDYPWKAASVFKLIPKAARDWLYDRIALNRYRLFGKYDYCSLPTADHEARFLDARK